MRADLVTAEVVPALRRFGVRAILLKGSSVAGWLYDDATDRPYVDCDLLVSPAEQFQAEKVLSALGFARTLGDADTPGWRQAAQRWSRGDDDADVDLHRTLIGVEGPPERLWQTLAANAERMPLGGTEVEVLRPSARALHIALHAAQHGPSSLQPLRDLERALQSLGGDTWHEAARLARDVGATGAFATGLRLLPAGRELAANLGLPAAASVEAELLATSPPPGALGWHDLARASGPVAKAQVIARKLVPTARFMREWSPLARRGRVGLAVAYGWRPLWVLMRVAPGLVAWQRVRRTVRRGEAISADGRATHRRGPARHRRSERGP